MNPRIIRTMLLSLLCMATVSVVQAASTVQGRIYLKDGRVIECGEKDRIELPKHERDVKLLRRAFYKDKSKEIYRYEEIDSIVCWHATAPEHPRKFIPGTRCRLVVGLRRDAAHLCRRLLAQGLRHRFERRHRGAGQIPLPQPLAHGLLPAHGR